MRGALLSHTVSDLTLSKTLRMAPAFMKGISYKTEVTAARGNDAKEKLMQWLD